MNKALKWILILVGSFAVLFLAAALIVPALFKDDIKALIEEQAAASVNAEVVFEDFNLSFFTNFPNITAGLENVGVINRAPFAGDVLFATERFDVEVNLVDLLFNDAVRVKGITLVRPVVNVKVLADGRANYDIALPSEDSVATTEESGDFAFGIDHWEIVDGVVTYDDETLSLLLAISGLHHTGSGDFTQDAFDLTTSTQADSVTTRYDGVEYLTNKKVEIDAILNISEDYTKYTFKDNTAKVNDFAFLAEGWLKLNEEDMEMDLAFSTPENSFKSLLSLVPGIYTEGFEDIRTEGELAFSGAVKGIYSEETMPAFNLALQVNDAMFQYPDLPTAVSNIQLDLLVDNTDGVIENTVVDLKNFHLDFGANPVDARAKISRLYPTRLDAAVAARLDLAELNKMFPMEGLDMRGNYALNLKADGVYDSVKKTVPTIDAQMSLANGYVKSADFPIPMDQMQFTSSISSPSGKMAETVIRVNDFSMLMDGEKLAADLVLRNLDNYTWDLKVNGGIDLEKITKIFPVEGTTLAGKIKADIQTSGNYADVEAERYDRLPTRGTASLQGFRYAAADVPTVTIRQASMAFDPRQINLQQMTGTLGKSDFDVKGAVTNYLGYVFGENETIRGKVTFNANLLDLNEFMTDEEETAMAEDTSSYSVIPVPRNIDFTLVSAIKTVQMMDFTMTNAAGEILVRDGVANLSGLRFKMLDGNFVVDGSYDTRDVRHPTYDFSLKIDDMSIQQAANSFSIVKTFAPIAGLVTGKFSTDFKINGELLNNMMPDLRSVSGGGLVEIAQAALTDSKFIAGITSLTKLDNTSDVSLKDVLMSASIQDGRLSVKPFDVKLGDYTTTVSGATLLDGSIDYNLKMDVPAGKLGSQFNALVARYGGQARGDNTIPVTIALGGTFTDPKPTLVMNEQAGEVREAVKEAAREEGTRAIEKAVKGTEAEKIVKDILGTTRTDSAAGPDSSATPQQAVQERVAEEKKRLEEEKKKVEQEAKDKIQNLLKRR